MTDSSRPRVRIETITPEKAQKLMDASDHDDPKRSSRFRRTSEHRARSYAEDMADDLWMLTGQGITIDKAGKLQDGWHRMRAIVLSGKPLDMVVLRGAEPRATLVVDEGRRRVLVDVLRVRGETSAATLAAGVKCLFDFKHNQLEKLGPRKSPTIDQLLTILGRAGDLLRARVRTVTGLPEKVRTIAPPGFVAMHLYLADMKLGRSVSEEWLEQLKNPRDLSRCDPVWRLVQAHEDDILARAQGKEPSSLRMRKALYLKAWALWLRGEELGTEKSNKRLRWTPTGPKPEPFPELVLSREVRQTG